MLFSSPWIPDLKIQKKNIFPTHFIWCWFHCPKVRISPHCWPWTSLEKNKTQFYGKRGPFPMINIKMHIRKNSVLPLTDNNLAFTGCNQNTYSQHLSLQTQFNLNLAGKKSLLWDITNRMHQNTCSQGMRTLPGLHGLCFAMKRMQSAGQTSSSVNRVQLVKRKW